MVYDRVRSGLGPHESASLGSSGHPRLRFPSDAAQFSQKPGPAQLHAAPSSTTPFTDDSLPSTRLILDLISERVSSYIQRDSADRKNRKLRLDVDRCQAGEFPGVTALLDVHLKSADYEKAKLNQRMSATDEKLVRVTSNWRSLLETAAQAKSINANDHHTPTPPPSETHSDIPLNIEERLAQMMNKIREESQNLQCKTKNDYEVEIAALKGELTQVKGELTQEKENSKCLQAELKSMAARLSAIETKVEDHAKISSQLGQAVQQESLVDLESRLVKIEITQTAMQKPDEYAGNGEIKHQDMDPAQCLCLELEAKLEDKMTQFLLQNSDKIVSDERILRLAQTTVKAVEAVLQSSLKRMADGFGTLIDKERERRASLSVQIQAAEQSASEAAQAVEVMRVEFTEAQTASNTCRQSNAATMKNQETQIQNLTELLASTQGKVESAETKLQQSIDTLWLRSTTMDAWRDNFSTARLFEALVQYLNSSFFPEHKSKLTHLRDRVANIESLLGDDGNKKRKLAEHGSSAFPSFINR
ncbi:hypothetical protein BB8028_0006g08140 [Beauveria bassiana]|uniref:Uncharacterized protein n=1 Tax=Beauveria bassiana TaxID=176275 RepID=A0A2S7YKI4_BEABA|nr:hypothetical protein BB8028_0006g08140 [Beauveria bassiana]